MKKFFNNKDDPFNPFEYTSIAYTSNDPYQLQDSTQGTIHFEYNTINQTQLAQGDLPPENQNPPQNGEGENEEEEEEVTAEDIEELEATAAGTGGGSGGIDEAIDILFGNDGAVVGSLGRNLNLAPFVRTVLQELEPTEFPPEIEEICSFQIDISFKGCFCQSCEMSLGEEYENFEQYANVDLSFNVVNDFTFLGLTITDGDYVQQLSIPIIGEVDCDCPIVSLQTDNYYIDSVYDLLEGDDFFFDCAGNCYSLVMLEDGDVPILQLEPCVCEIELDVFWTNLDSSVAEMDQMYNHVDPIADFNEYYDWSFVSGNGETFLEFSFMQNEGYETIQFTVPDGMNCACPIENLVIDYGMFYDYFYSGEYSSETLDGFDFVHFVCYGGGFFQDCDGVNYQFNYDFENGYSIVEAECVEVSVNINLTDIEEYICEEQVTEALEVETTNGTNANIEDFSTYLSQALGAALIDCNGVSYLELSLTNCPCYQPGFDGTYDSESQSLGEYFDQFQVCPETIRISLPDGLDTECPIVDLNLDIENIYNYLYSYGYGESFDGGEYAVSMIDLLDALWDSNRFVDCNDNCYTLGYDYNSGEYTLDCWRQEVCVDLVGCMGESMLPVIEQQLYIGGNEYDFEFVTCVDGPYLSFTEYSNTDNIDTGYGDIHIAVPDSLSCSCPIVELVIDYDYYNDVYGFYGQQLNGDYSGDSEFLSFLANGGGIFYDCEGTCYELNYDYYNGWSLQECCECVEVNVTIGFEILEDYGSGIDWREFDAGVQDATMGDIETQLLAALNQAFSYTFLDKNGFTFLELTYTDPLNADNTSMVRMGLPQNLSSENPITELLIDFTEIPQLAIQGNNTNGFSGLDISQILSMLSEANLLFTDSNGQCYEVTQEMYSNEYCLEPTCTDSEIQNTVIGLPCAQEYYEPVFDVEDLMYDLNFYFESCYEEGNGIWFEFEGEYYDEFLITVPDNINCLNQITDLMMDFTAMDDYLYTLMDYSFEYEDYDYRGIDILNAIALGGGFFLDSEGTAYMLAYEGGGYTLQECCDVCVNDITISFENIWDYGADIPWQDFDLGYMELTMGEAATQLEALIANAFSMQVISCNGTSFLEFTYTDPTYLENGFFNTEWNIEDYQQSVVFSLPNGINCDNTITDMLLDFTTILDIGQEALMTGGFGGLSLESIFFNMLENEPVFKDENGNILTFHQDNESSNYCIDYCNTYDEINFTQVGLECTNPFDEEPFYNDYDLEYFGNMFSFVDYNATSFVLFNSGFTTDIEIQNEFTYEYEGIHIHVPEGLNCLCPIEDLVINQAFINDYLTKLDELDGYELNELDFLNAIALGGGTFIDCEGTKYELHMDGYAQYSLQECCTCCDVNVTIGIDNLRFYGQDVDWESFPSDFGLLTLGEVSEGVLDAVNDVLDISVIQCNNTSFIEFTYTDPSAIDEDGFINTDWDFEAYQQSMRISLPDGFECDCEELELLFDFFWVNQLATEALNTDGFEGLDIEQFFDSIMDKQAVLLDCNNEALQLFYDDETGDYCFDWTTCFEEVNLNIPDTDPFDTVPAMTFVSIQGESFLVFSESGELVEPGPDPFPEDSIYIMVPDGLGCLCPIEELIIDQDFFNSYFDGDYPVDDESFLEFIDLGGAVFEDCEGTQYQLSWDSEYGYKLEDFDDCEFEVNVQFDVLSDPWEFDFEDTSHAELEAFAADILAAVDVTFYRADGISYLSVSYTDPDNMPIIEDINIFLPDDLNCDNPISSLTLDYLTLYEYMDEEGLSDLEDFIDALTGGDVVAKFTDSLGNAWETDGSYEGNNLQLEPCSCEYDINMSLLNLDCAVFEPDEPPVGLSTFTLEQEGNQAYLTWSLNNAPYSESATVLLPSAISCLNQIENIMVDYGLFTDLYYNDSNTTIFDYLALGGGVFEDSDGNFYELQYDGQGVYSLSDEVCDVWTTDITIGFADTVDYGDPLPWQDYDSGYASFTLGEIAQQVVDAFNAVVDINFVSVNGLSWVEYTYTGGENPYGEENSWADMFEGETVRISVPQGVDCDCPIDELLFDFATLETFVTQGMNTDGFTGLLIEQMLNGLINGEGIFLDCEDNSFQMQIDEETNQYCIDYTCCFEPVYVDIVGIDCKAEIDGSDLEYLAQMSDFTFASCEGESALFFTPQEFGFQAEGFDFDIEGFQINVPDGLNCLNPIIDVVLDYTFLEDYFNTLDEEGGEFNDFATLTALSLGGAAFFDGAGTAYNMTWVDGEGFSLVESCNTCTTSVSLNYESLEGEEDLSSFTDLLDSTFGVGFVAVDNLSFVEITYTNQDVNFMDALENDFEGVYDSVRISVPDGLNCDCTLTALNFNYDTLAEMYSEFGMDINLEDFVFSILDGDAIFEDCNSNCYSLNFNEEYGTFCIDCWEQYVNVDILGCEAPSQLEGESQNGIVDYSFGFVSCVEGPFLLFNQSIDGPFATFPDGEYQGIKIALPQDAGFNCECFIEDLVIDYNLYQDIYGYGPSGGVSTDFLTFLTQGGGLFFDCDDTCYTLEYDYYNGYSLQECCTCCEVDVTLSFTDIANYENNYEYSDEFDQNYTDLEAMMQEFNDSVDISLISCEDNNFSFLEITHTVENEEGGYTDSIRLSVPQNIDCDCTIESLVLDYNVLYDTQNLNGSFMSVLLGALADGAGSFLDCNNNCLVVEYNEGTYCIDYACESQEIEVNYVAFDCGATETPDTVVNNGYEFSFSNCEGESTVEFGYYDMYNSWQTVTIDTPDGVNCLCPVTNLIINQENYDNYFINNPLFENGYETTGMDMMHFLAYGGGVFLDCENNCYELAYDSQQGYTLQAADVTVSSVSVDLFNQPTEPNGDITLLSYISSMLNVSMICCDDINYLQLSYTNEMMQNFDFYGRDNFSDTMIIALPEGIDCDCPIESLMLDYEYFSSLYSGQDLSEQNILGDIIDALTNDAAYLYDCNEVCYEISFNEAFGDYCAVECDEPTVIETPQEPPLVTPVILDLAGDGVELINVIDSNVQFDVDNDGETETMGWVGADDAILVYDYNQDGKVTEVNEFALANHHDDATTDLEGLQLAFDSNHDGVFDANDAAWSQFGLWQDQNGNGITDDGEFTSLVDSQILSINLTSDNIGSVNAGNVVFGQSDYTLKDGSLGTVLDVGLQYEDVIGDDSLALLIGEDASNTQSQLESTNYNMMSAEVTGSAPTLVESIMPESISHDDSSLII